MAKRAVNVNLFLLDGDPRGTIKASMANWTGVAYKIPRTNLNNLDNRQDLKQSGVYFLFGTNDTTDGNETPVVYIGQAGIRKNGEGILYRLQEHRRNEHKNYWTHAVAFTSTNDFLAPTEISYLENRFYNLALNAGRYQVMNANDPNPGNPTEEKQSELEQFIDNATLIMGVLGYQVFEPLNENKHEEPADRRSEDLELHITHKSKEQGTITANALQTSEGIVVLKGSRISTTEADSLPKNSRERRANANIKDGILQEDTLFPSPSAASNFVLGYSTSGLREWKTNNGQPLEKAED